MHDRRTTASDNERVIHEIWFPKHEPYIVNKARMQGTRPQPLRAQPTTHVTQVVRPSGRQVKCTVVTPEMQFYVTAFSPFIASAGLFVIMDGRLDSKITALDAKITAVEGRLSSKIDGLIKDVQASQSQSTIAIAEVGVLKEVVFRAQEGNRNRIQMPWQ